MKIEKKLPGHYLTLVDNSDKDKNIAQLWKSGALAEALENYFGIDITEQ